MFIFLFCPLLGCLLLLFILLSCSLPSCTVLIFLLVCFWRSWFCSPAIIHISNQSKAWFSFIFLYSWKKYHRLGSPSLPINYTNMQLYEEKYVSYSISAESIFDQSGNWLDKNIFHLIVKTGFMDDFITYLLPASVMNCENCQLFLSNGTINFLQWRTTYPPPPTHIYYYASRI